MPDLFPEVVAGQWQRTSRRDLPAGESPDPVPRNSIERLQTANYEMPGKQGPGKQGPGQLEARVYRLSSAAVGLDVAQRWRPSATRRFRRSS